jgi:hypothetical protein
MNQPKYQVFISSTYEDLKEPREQVLKAVLRMGHIPVGMELFHAGNEDQWSTITKHIGQSDYYILLVAHRYGSTYEGFSYTEKEYDYAIAHGVPVLGFIHDGKSSWPPNLMDTGPDKQKLDKFKAKVKKKMVNFWGSSEQLQSLVISSLTDLTVHSPRPGWVRGSAAAEEVAEELSVLSKENRDLRQRVEVMKSELLGSANERAILDHRISVSFTYVDKDHKRITASRTLDIREIIDIVGEYLLLSPSATDISIGIAESLAKAIEPLGIDRAAIPMLVRPSLYDVTLRLVVFGLILPLSASVDHDPPCKLSDKGVELVTRLRATALLGPATPPEQPDPPSD